MIKENFFGYDKFSFGNEKLEISVISLGATVTSLKYEGRELLLNYGDAQGYLDGSSYICAAIGRYANRIGGSRFELDGKEYLLAANEGSNQLHGGPRSYDKRRWDAEILSDNSLRMSIHSPDGDNGYPGALDMAVTYTVEGSSFIMLFEGISDADTHFAPTTHVYFDLDGERNILEHKLFIDSRGWLEVDGELIPTGRIMPPEGDFDFSSLRKIERDYDHCFILGSEHACTLASGGLRMELYTDFPALQIYTSSAMGEPFGAHSAVAVEPEFYPDSPNKPHFPSTLLKAGEKFEKFARFKFYKD